MAAINRSSSGVFSPEPLALRSVVCCNADGWQNAHYGTKTLSIWRWYERKFGNGEAYPGRTGGHAVENRLGTASAGPERWYLWLGGRQDSYCSINIAVNEYGKAFAQRIRSEHELRGSFGFRLPVGADVVHVDAIVEVPSSQAIYHAHCHGPRLRVEEN